MIICPGWFLVAVFSKKTHDNEKGHHLKNTGTGFLCDG